MSSVLELGCIRMRDVDCILCCVASQRLSCTVLSLKRDVKRERARVLTFISG